MLTLFVNYLEEHEDEILDELKTYFKEEGKEEGKLESSSEIAKNLKGILSDEEISRVTEVPLEKVAQL